ncbi:hypothetical protein [Cognatiyoonia sp. IB215446]|uniref:hypothetical protein n=1 Tax=Cognatiyoonia sp. IB215446 TaxID=3097355 RepID=UPI002A24C5C7|nr:hypothetical protein [Cognatiyoonia sp. IB215446]
MASMAQANATSTCLSAEARSIKGVHHTVTVWTSRDDMIAYLHAEPHLSAMKAFRRIATGKVYGFETEHIPSWAEARRLWDEKGREVRG